MWKNNLWRVLSFKFKFIFLESSVFKYLIIWYKNNVVKWTTLLSEVSQVDQVILSFWTWVGAETSQTGRFFLSLKTYIVSLIWI